MPKSKTSYLLLMILAVAAPQAAFGQREKLEEAAKLFAYDAAAPLDIQQIRSEDRGGIQVRDITYASPLGGQVPAYLVVPQGKDPFAGIVFVHWGQGDRSEFLAEALLLARTGTFSLLIEAPMMRPEPWRRDSGLEQYIQLVVDSRRALDVLTSLPNVDSTRIAYVGHSLGATWGGVLAGVEKRFKAYVLMGGLPALSEYTRDHWNPEEGSKEQLDRTVAALAPLDAVNFVSRAAPAAILFQFARVDSYISEADALKYERAASEPKMTMWYEGGHEFTDVRALLDRADFLRQQIGLGSLRPHLPCE